MRPQNMESFPEFALIHHAIRNEVGVSRGTGGIVALLGKYHAWNVSFPANRIYRSSCRGNILGRSKINYKHNNSKAT